METTTRRYSTRKTNPAWEVGETVKVGFMTLRIMGRIATPGNHSPDEFAMESLDGSKFYTFCPHRGLHRAASRADAFVAVY